MATLAFQAKMIEAWAVVPALALAYLVAAPGPLAVRLRRFVVAGVVMVIVSLSWMTAVSLVPANDRPYVPISAPAAGPPVHSYGGVVMPHSDADDWLRLDELKHQFTAGLDGRRILIFTSAEAGNFVLAGVPNVEPVGGYTGLTGAPGVAQLRTEIIEGEIALAIVPDDDDGDVRSSDPRIELVKQLCIATDPDFAAAIVFTAQVYDCARGV